MATILQKDTVAEVLLKTPPCKREGSETSCDDTRSTRSPANVRGTFIAKSCCSVGPGCVWRNYSSAESPHEELESPEKEASWFLLGSEADVWLARCTLTGELGIILLATFRSHPVLVLLG